MGNSLPEPFKSTVEEEEKLLALEDRTNENDDKSWDDMTVGKVELELVTESSDPAVPKASNTDELCKLVNHSSN